MADWVSAIDRWQGTKDKFQKLTGEKKPKPKGFMAKTFGHTGLKSALQATDKMVAKLEEAQYMPSGENRDKLLEKRLAEADKVLKSLKKACADYVKVSEKEAAAEKAEEAEKTQRYRALKMLGAELDQICANFDQKVSSLRTTNDQELSSREKFAKMTRKGLTAACKTAAAAVKKVKADPTPENYNALFAVQNTPGRQINVQLAQAIKFGLPPATVDPATVKEKLMDWNASNSAKSSIPTDATKQQVLTRVAEFTDALKFAIRYCDDLN